MDWKGIVVHCSDSKFGCARLIDEWHRGQNWDRIGYHFVIQNGLRNSTESYCHLLDGQIEAGRSVNEAGAHAFKYNRSHLGICLIGVDDFTHKQMGALSTLVTGLMARYDIPYSEVIAHYQCSTSAGKTCPNFNIDAFKHKLRV